MDTTPVLAVAAVIGGAIAAPLLATRGLRELQRLVTAPPWFQLAAGAAGAAASVAIAMFADRRAETLPALLAWGCALIAIASCDALTQRIPTALVRQSTVTVALLLIGGGLVSGCWESVAHSAGWAAAAGAALLAAHHFADTGAGDVRLAILGGLGLTAATASSVLIGVAMWATVVLVQTVATVGRGGTLRSRIALGPGLAAGFVVAALLPG